jgi:uncharacterized repeat protein (TIGR03803 family)
MNINPPPGPFIAPGQIGSVLQSGDGNFYASASGVCGVNAGGFCDYILRIDALGAVTTLHTFELDGSNNTNDDGSSITQLLEARDGALYGTAKKGGPYGTGTIFRITHDGTFSLLQDYPFRTYGYGGYGTSYHCGNYYSYTAPAYTVGGYPGPLTEGADGNLYGLQHNGNASGASTQGAFFRITPGGDFSVIRNFVPVNSYLSGGDGPGNCGATVVSTPNDPVFITADFAVDPPQLLQALDGSFYAQMTGSDTSEELDTLARLPGNQAVPVYNLSSNGAAGCGSNAPLIEGSNGGLYSYTTSGDFVFLNGNLQLFNSTPLPSWAVTPTSTPPPPGPPAATTATSRRSRRWVRAPSSPTSATATPTLPFKPAMAVGRSAKPPTATLSAALSATTAPNPPPRPPPISCSTFPPAASLPARSTSPSPLQRPRSIKPSCLRGRSPMSFHSPPSNAMRPYSSLPRAPRPTLVTEPERNTARSMAASTLALRPLCLPAPEPTPMPSPAEARSRATPS